MILNKANILKVLSNIYLKKKTPISLIHFITNRCNARCSFCFIDFNNPNTFKNELTLSEINKMTLHMPNTLLNINFTGGEPFAKKEIVEIAQSYLRNTTIQSIYITTNASLPDRILDFAKKISKFDEEVEINFQISIDNLPDLHDKNRKIKNLFNNCIESYNVLKNLKNPKITPTVNITVSEDNCDNIKDVFNYLLNKTNINSIKCCIVRDEGVYKTPYEKKKKIYQAYEWLTENIKAKKKEGIIKNYSDTLQGKIHNQKDNISWDMVKKTYLTNNYLSPCHASSLFGVITAKGDVYPCEILENKLIGNLRDYEMNFLKLWDNKNNKEIKDFIKKTKCRCTYECALSFNILGNFRYQYKLLKSFISKY